MGTSPHPDTSLEDLKRQAGSMTTLARLRTCFPYPSEDATRFGRPRMTDCQIVLAREGKFVSWQ